MIEQLDAIVQRWLRRRRWQRCARWASRGLVAGLAVGLAAGVALLSRAALLRGEFVLLLTALPLVAAALLAAAGYAWPLARLAAAREFDLELHLQERVSTALELGAGARPAGEPFARLQLADALDAARRVQHARAMPVRAGRAETVLALVLAALAALVWFQGETWFRAARQARAVEAAVEAQAAAIEELLAGVEADPGLSPQDAGALAEPLQEALQALESNPSLEGSVSALVSAGEALQALADPQAQAMAQALRAAGQSLAGQPGSPLADLGQALASGEPLAAAGELAGLDPGAMSPAAMGQTAAQLSALAEALAATHPKLAAQLQAAAQAMEAGDADAAQAALDAAADALAQAGSQLHASQTAAELSAGMQAGAQGVLAAGGGGTPESGLASTGGSGESEGAGPGSGSGTGSAAGGEPAAGGEAGNEPIPQGNGPGDGGETPFEAIYAPELLGGEGGPLVGLPGSGAEAGETVGEGPAGLPEPAAPLVPYDQVYAMYEEASRQAIERGEIPAQFIQIVRRYFDALEP